MEEEEEEEEVMLAARVLMKGTSCKYLRLQTATDGTFLCGVATRPPDRIGSSLAANVDNPPQPQISF
jgi:hypothetical protein